jgi:hypothetical protein
VADSQPAREEVRKLGVEPGIQHEAGPNGVDQDKKEQLESVKRWHNGDWKNFDKKLQSSIVEGISVFLSLFDDNPRVKRTFCPPVELYRNGHSATTTRKPLPPLATLLEQGKVIALDFPASVNPGLARHRRDAQDGLPTSRSESNSANSRQSRKAVAAHPIYMRRIPALRHGR